MQCTDSREPRPLSAPQGRERELRKKLLRQHKTAPKPKPSLLVAPRAAPTRLAAAPPRDGARPDLRKQLTKEAGAGNPEPAARPALL